MTKPICLFDSGIGGLTVLKKLLEKSLSGNYIYLADLARVPFGDRTNKEIEGIAGELIEWLLKFNSKAVIMACNTSSAVLCREGRIYPAPTVPLYGMIESCAKEIAKRNYKKVSVWATKLVIENKGYSSFIKTYNPDIEVEEISCPKLVPMIEDLNFNYTDKQKIITEYVEKTSKDSEALILGCTHYPLIQESIKKIRDIEIIDPAVALVEELCDRDGINRVSAGVKPQITLYATAQAEKLQRFSKIYLGMDLKVSSISLSKIVV